MDSRREPRNGLNAYRGSSIRASGGLTLGIESIVAGCIAVWLCIVLVAQSVDEEARLIAGVVALASLPAMLIFFGQRPIGADILTRSTFAERVCLVGFWTAAAMSALLSLQPLTSFEFLILTIATMVLSARLWTINFVAVYRGLALYAFLGSGLLVILTLAFGFDPGERLSTFRNANGIGLLCYSCAALSLLIQRRLYRWAALCMALGVLVLTGSRTSSLGLVVAISTFLLPTILRQSPGRKFLLAVAAAAVAATIAANWETVWWELNDFFALDDPYRGLNTGFTGRDVLWQYAWRLFLDNPYFGVGYRLHELYFAMSNPDISAPGSAHNGYLAALAELGIIGAIPLFTWIALRTVKLVQFGMQSHPRRVAIAFIAGYLFISLFERFLLALGNPTSLIFVLLLLQPSQPRGEHAR